MPNLLAIGKGCFLAIIMVALGLFILAQCLSARHVPAAYNALSVTCADKTGVLADLLRKYHVKHGKYPSDLVDLIPLASYPSWCFSCDLVGNDKFEAMVSPPNYREVDTGRGPILITYLYFTNAVQGVRLICQTCHARLTAVDATGNIIDVNRERWQTLKNELDRNE